MHSNLPMLSREWFSINSNSLEVPQEFNGTYSNESRNGVHFYDNVRVRKSDISIGSKIGDHSIIVASTIDSNVSVNRMNTVVSSSIGRYTYTGRLTTIQSTVIGRFVSISWGCTIGAGGHDYRNSSNYPLYKFIDTYTMSTEARDALVGTKVKTHSRIGSDVWIASHAIILKGFSIGDGAVIGAGAVVTKDVEPYAIVAGVPAREIKKRFDEQTIKTLTEVRWWDWPIELIYENKTLLFNCTLREHNLQQLRINDKWNDSRNDT